MSKDSLKLEILISMSNDSFSKEHHLLVIVKPICGRPIYL